MYIRIKDGILDMKNTNKCIYVIRDIKESGEFRYVSYLWDNWRNYFLIDYQNCMLFSYNSAQSFISDLIQENLEYQNLVIELSPYYKDCKQADTIEELCDEFVYDYGKDKDRFKNDELAIKILKANNNEKVNIYGAIWTSKGLIYVAKMNDKGDLLLLW